MATESELLTQLAERPFDRSLRQVFADWLLEQGDVRGELITAADPTALPLSERRRLARLTQEHGPRWLGPLAALVDAAASRFEQSFLSHAVVVAPADPSLWRRLAGDPRLATVTSLDLPPMASAEPMVAFLRHPVLRNVRRVQASAAGLSALGEDPRPAFALDVVALSSWGVFTEELGSVERLVTSPSPRLDLVTSEFVNPLVAQEVLRSVSSHEGPRRFKELRLVTRFGVFEGVVAWLNHGATPEAERGWPRLDAWSAAYAEGIYRLTRAPSRFSCLSVDLRHGEELVGLGQRIASAASVLVLLGPARLEEVTVLLPASSRLRPTERDALRAAVRRLGTVKRFTLGADTVVP